MSNATHLYIHVPFCARRCVYCDFAIAVRRHIPHADYARAVIDERRARALVAATTVPTIYFGGGTPSRLDPAALGAILDAVRRDHAVECDAEITMEANPDDVTPDSAAAWAAIGINRVSLGVQSHDPEVLRWMHRTHHADQVSAAVRLLRDAGIASISLDLIFALPDAVPRDWERDLDATLALAPDHISLYGLTVESHTPLAHWRDRGVVDVAPDGRYADEYIASHRTLAAAGFEHYEVSNFARPGHRARHNAAYWAGGDYLGLGPSAHSLIDGVRQWNVREWADYQERSARGESTMAGREVLDDRARALEALYLGLRTTTGVPSDLVPASQRAAWVDAGWATDDGRTLRLTVDGWLRLDALVASAGDF